jgi:molybdate transport system regulatory protein
VKPQHSAWQNQQAYRKAGQGNVISAIITHGSSEKLSLKEGDTACAVFKASSVIIGVS